jgi:DNA-binding MarR family transcriptional regulator
MFMAPSGRAGFSLERYLFFWTTHVSVLYANHMRKAMKGTGGNLVTWRALAVLAEFGPATISGLAQATTVERTALTRTISQLERMGLLTKKNDAGDKRRTLVVMTAKGLKRYQELVPIFESVLQRAVGKKPDVDSRALIASLQQIAANLEGHRYDPLSRKLILPAPDHKVNRVG